MTERFLSEDTFSATPTASVKGAFVRTVRDVRYDFGRCFAALFVIYVHSSVAYLPQISRIDISNWLLADVTNSIGRVAVPIFLMMSGALVLGKPVANWSSYMKKRAGATLKPYFFGAAFYLIWQQLALGIHPASVYEFVKSVILGNAFVHLYFLFILFGLYIISPLLQKICELPLDTVAKTTALLFVLAVVDRHLAPFELSLGYLSLGTCYSFLPYFLSGFVLSRMQLPSMTKSALAFFIFTILTTAIAFVSYYNNWAIVSENFLQYTSANVVAQALAVFCVMMQISIRSRFAAEIIRFFAELSLGIYILHYAVLAEMHLLVPRLIAVPLIIQILLYPIFCFFLTATIVHILHKIPKVKGFI